MQTFWLKFEDGSFACCDGQSPYDAISIAEHLSKKKVAAQPGAKTSDYSADGKEIKSLPYPADPCIWKFAHPKHGPCPSFCYKPHQCAGKTACPQNRACDD